MHQPPPLLLRLQASQYKVGDFGLALTCEDNHYNGNRNSAYGTTAFMSPECLQELVGPCCRRTLPVERARC